MIDGVPVSTFDRIVAEIEKSKGAKDDAAMEYAGGFKALKEKGCDTRALKEALKLRRWDQDKVRSYLESLHRYLTHFGVFSQMELPLSGGGHAAGTGADVVPFVQQRQSADDDFSVGDAEFVDADDDAEPGDACIESAPPLENEWLEASPAEEARNIPDAPGKIYEEGRLAGIAGNAPDDNPYTEGSRAAALWESGWQNGRLADDDGQETDSVQ